MNEILCPTCGKPNSDDHNFCDHCGAPLFSVDPFPADSPSLRDDLFNDSEDKTPVQSPIPQDEASRLDSLLSDPDPTEDPLPLSEFQEDSSRLDDLIPAPEPAAEYQVENKNLQTGESDDSSRLDDFFTTDDPFISAEEEKPDPPAFDPFLDPSARDELLREDTPVEKNGGSWEYLTEPSAENSLTEKTQPIEKPADNLDFLNSLADDNNLEEKSPPQKPAEEEDFLAALAAEETPLQKEDPKQDPVDWDFLTTPGAAEEPSKPDLSDQDTAGELEFLAALNREEDTAEAEEPQKPKPHDQDTAGELEFLAALNREEDTPGTETPITPKQSDQDTGGELEFLAAMDREDGKAEEQSIEKSAGEWDFLTSSAAEEAPPKTEEPDQDTVDGWDFLSTPDSEEEPVISDQTGQDTAEGLDFLAALDGEENVSGPDQPTSGQAGELDFLTPDPETEPGPIGFRPDLYDEDEDPLPEFGTPSFSEDSGWLDMLQDPDSRKAAVDAPPEPTKPQTDWLDKIKRLNKSSDLVDEDSSFPDWLSVSDKPAEESPEEVLPVEDLEPVSENEEAAPASDLPAWLQIDGDDESLNAFLRKKDLTNEEYKPAIIRGITDKLAQDDDEDEPAAGLSDSQQIKFPSWAEEKKKAAEKISPDLEFLAGHEDGTDPIIDPFQVEEEEFFDDLFSDELPGWLTSASSDSAFEDFEDELSQGELPGWVEAMRPVVESSDATGLSEDEDYIENYGPLAGIPSVLPAEADVAFDPEKAARKPLDLIASSSHKDYVNVLKTLITDENKTKTILKPAPVATQRVLRWLIALIMLVTTAGTVIFGGVIETNPPSSAQIINTGYGALYEQIEGLHDGQSVLIAFDYQPASAGELHTAAAGVVDHLMKQGTYLSFISTQPTGPALADHFLATTQEKHEYIHTQQYINLGYLPGESAGLLSFVIAPKKIIPLAFDGSNAWGSPPLLNVNSINDFAMVLVITDDPETAKIWIEQVGTILEDTPLNMVVGAQAEPLIQPYFRSSPQLLKGYVSGIIDSMNYEQLLNRPNLATAAWLPFNIGIIITVGTIFIGGLANGVLSLFSRHRSRSAGDAK